MTMIHVIFIITWAVLLFVLVTAWRRLMKSCDENNRLVSDELAKVWRRLEWLCKDTDDRLSVDRVELQQRALQIKNLQIRTKTIEKYLYLDAKDAFKEQEDGNDD